MTRRARGPGPRAAALALAAVLAAGAARGHVVYGTPTLRLLTSQADLVARARIVDPDAELWLEDPLVREAVVVAEVLEALKGAFAEPRLRFVQHGHGVPLYAENEEVVLFLQQIENSRELAGSPIAARIRWVSGQEAGVKFPLDAGTRLAFTGAVRAYAALDTLAPGERLAAMRRLTLELLASPHPELARSALRDLVLAGDSLPLGAEDLAVLEPLLASPATQAGVRMGLLVELERRGLVEGAARWAALVRDSSGPDRFAVVRAAAAHPSEAVSRELLRLLASQDPQLVAAAAVSLGAPGNAMAVAPLSKLLASEEERVRLAAIRGLGGVGTPDAKAALAQAAASHPEPGTRRRAAAELTLLERQPMPRSGWAR